jgi:hypothetical protein
MIDRILFILIIVAIVTVCNVIIFKQINDIERKNKNGKH